MCCRELISDEEDDQNLDDIDLSDEDLIPEEDIVITLTEKGYNPINQIVGYILSGDPTYITSHNGARNLIRQVERDELLEEMVKNYIGLDK